MEVASSPSSSSGGNLGIRGLWECMTGPTKFFGELKERPTFLVPWLAIAILFTLSMFLLFPFIKDEMIRSMAEQNAKNPAMSGELSDEAKSSMALFGSVAAGVGVVGILPLLSSAIVLFFGNFVFGKKGTYKQILSASLYAFFVFCLVGLLAIPLQFARGDMTATLSLAVFAPTQSMSNPLWLALSKISLSSICEAIVLGIACQQIFSVERNKGIMIAVISLGTLSGIHVLFGVIGAMFK